METLKIVVEALFSFGLTVNAFLFIPQIIKLIKTKNPEGLSLVTFIGFNCIQMLGVMHCILRADYFPMIGWVVSLITCGSVTCLIIYYKSFYKDSNL